MNKSNTNNTKQEEDKRWTKTFSTSEAAATKLGLIQLWWLTDRCSRTWMDSFSHRCVHRHFECWRSFFKTPTKDLIPWAGILVCNYRVAEDNYGPLKAPTLCILAFKVLLHTQGMWPHQAQCMLGHSFKWGWWCGKPIMRKKLKTGIRVKMNFQEACLSAVALRVVYNLETRCNVLDIAMNILSIGSTLRYHKMLCVSWRSDTLGI